MTSDAGSDRNPQLDADILALDLDEVAKIFVQTARNAKRAADKQRMLEFVAEADGRAVDTEPLRAVLAAIATDEPRFLPVVACAYFDSALKQMFRREVPDGVPGGKDSLLGPFGPFSSLGRMIQLAYYFGWINHEFLADIDALRAVRNELSHKWDHTPLLDFFSTPRMTHITPIEQAMVEEEHLMPEQAAGLDPLTRFRVRLIWLVGLGYYETLLYPAALKKGLEPVSALYLTKPSPRLLQTVATTCMRATRTLVPKPDAPAPPKPPAGAA